jgi:hypothetical protein
MPSGRAAGPSEWRAGAAMGYAYVRPGDEPLRGDASMAVRVKG